MIIASLFLNVNKIDDIFISTQQFMFNLLCLGNKYTINIGTGCFCARIYRRNGARFTIIYLYYYFVLIIKQYRQEIPLRFPFVCGLIGGQYHV